MGWYKDYSGKRDDLDQEDGQQGNVGGLLQTFLGRNHDQEVQSGYPKGGLLNNITGQGKGGFFNNFAGGVFGGKYYQGIGRAFAGKSKNEGGMFGPYLNGIFSSLLAQNNQNNDPSLESVLSMVGGGKSGGSSSGSTPSIDFGTVGSDGTRTFTDSASSGSNGIDYGSILSSLSSFMNKGQHTNSDGSGVYGSEGTPTSNMGSSNGIDVNQIFKLFQQSQQQQESPEQTAYMIKNKYPWIPDDTFQKWLRSQPPSQPMQFAMPRY